eukprot:gene9296-11393_t
MTSKSVIFRELGNANVLKVEETQIPTPGQGEVLVRIHAVGLNRAEVMFREGKYFETVQLPSSLGCEGSGVVEAIGEGVKSFKVGDAVSVLPNIQMAKYPTNKIHGLFPEHGLALNPEGSSHVEVASMWLAYLTGYFALWDIGKIKKDDFVVVTAASSSTGLAAIQLAKLAGAKVIATSRTSEKKDKLLEYGADYFIATKEEDFEKAIARITNGKGTNIIYDCIAGEAMNSYAKASASRGSIIVYGSLAEDASCPFPLMQAMAKHLNIHGYLLFEFSLVPEDLARGVDYVRKHFKSFKSIVGKEFHGIDQVPEAHKFLDSKNLFGKAVVKF